MKAFHIIFWTVAMVAWTVLLTVTGKPIPWLPACAGYVLLFFGYQITQPRTKSPPPASGPRPVTIEDWLFSHKGPEVKFDLPYSPGKNETVACKVSCKHAGNWVYSSVGVGASPEDALQKAVAQIEETIGTGWRAKRNLLPVPVRENGD